MIAGVIRSDSFFCDLFSLAGATKPKQLEFLAADPVVENKELLDLDTSVLVEVFDVFAVVVGARLHRHCHKPIIPLSRAIPFGLFRFDYADQTGRHKATTKGRL